MPAEENLQLPNHRSLSAARWVLGTAALFTVAASEFPIESHNDVLWIWIRDFLSYLRDLIAIRDYDDLLFNLLPISLISAYALTILICPWVTQLINRTPRLLWCLRIFVTASGGYLFHLLNTHQMSGDGDWKVLFISLFAVIWIVYGIRRWKAIAWGLAIGYSVCLAGYILIVLSDLNWDWDTGGWLLASVAVLELIGLLLIRPSPQPRE